MKILELLFFSILACFCLHAQNTAGPSGQHFFAAGYKNIILTDSGRLYKSNTQANTKFHYRPVELDLWYPAIKPASVPAVRYGDFLNMLEERSNRFQDDTIYQTMSQELIQYLSLNMNISDRSSLSRLVTASYRNAEPAPGRFPLILYLCSFNGMGYENLSLFEWLAAHGYIVVSVTSVGRYPGNMSTGPEDLIQQVDDADFAIRKSKDWNVSDSLNIGAIGYSWGGLATAVLAMKNSKVHAVLSLDGSEMYYYGGSFQQDSDFNLLRNSLQFQPRRIKASYTYLESGFKQTDQIADSIYNLMTSLAPGNIYLRFPQATHEDFSCLPSLGMAANTGQKVDEVQFYRQLKAFALSYFDQHLKGVPSGDLERLSIIDSKGKQISTYPAPVKTKMISFHGRVLDAADISPLAYVNVGIPSKNTGTVTGKNGDFTIHFEEALTSDSLLVSMAGYQSRKIAIKSLMQAKQPATCLLEKKVTELQQVVISSRSRTTKVTGNTSTSKFVSVCLPLKFLGSETGIRMKLGKKPVWLKSFSFTVSENRLDTALFRLNVYDFKNGIPNENIVKQNILVSVGKQSGTHRVDLSAFKLILSGDILVSLEWIEGSGANQSNPAIFFSAGFLNSSTWHRLASQAEWKKAPGLGVGFNAVIQEIKY